MGVKFWNYVVQWFVIWKPRNRARFFVSIFPNLTPMLICDVVLVKQALADIAVFFLPTTFSLQSVVDGEAIAFEFLYGRK